MVQLQLLNKILTTGDKNILIYNNLDEEYFPSFKEEYKYIKNHIDVYDRVPDAYTFADVFHEFKFIDVQEDIEYLVKTIKEERFERLLAKANQEMIKTASSEGALSAAMQMKAALDEMLTQVSTNTVDILKDTSSRYDKFLDRCAHKEQYLIKTGFDELDRIIGGWDAKEELATIAARTNMGKSWLLIKSALAAVTQGLRVGFYSGEMSVDKVAYRFDTLYSHISNFAITKGQSTVQPTYKQFLDTLSVKFGDNVCLKILTPNMIDGPAGVTALGAFIDRDNLDILFVDQHSLLEDDRKAKNPVERASNISKDLKNLQVMKQIPIITASQQNRTSTENGVGTEHIAQSDRIAQDSTTIIFFEQDKDHKLLTMNLVKSRDSANGQKLQYEVNFDTGMFRYIVDTDDGKSTPETEALKAPFAEPNNEDVSEPF